MENNLLRNFVTIEQFRNERPRLSIMNDEQIQEALNIATTMLDGICNGLISLVIQYSLSRDKKDECDELFRTDFELNQIKNAIVFQTQYVLNLGNDFTIGSNSASTGGINYSFQRPEARQELAPGVKEFLARARVFELTNIGSDYVPQKKQGCNIFKEFLNIEDGDKRYVKEFQPNADVGSIAVIGDGHTVAWTNPQNAQWGSLTAKKILDIDGEYKPIQDIDNLAFFGNDSSQAMTRQETYNAIWNSMFYNPNVTYPNEAIIRVYNERKNLVYTFKSNQDNNKGHHPLLDNENQFWWKEVGVADKVDFDELVDRVINAKEFIKKLVDIKNEFDNTLDAFWNQIKDNPHLLQKFEELYDQTKTENDQLEQKLDTKIQANTTLINDLDKSNIAYKNKDNTFLGLNNFDKEIQIIGTRNTKPAYISFFNDTTRLGYVGNPSSTTSDFVVQSERDHLWFIAPNGKEIKIGSENNVYSQKAPSQPQHLTNKKYVDTKIEQEISNIETGNIDTSNLAKLNMENEFNAKQIFSQGAKFGYLENYVIDGNGRGSFKLLQVEDSISSPHFIITGDETLRDNDCVPKKYVDNATNEGLIYIVEKPITLNINKRDVAKDLWFYVINSTSFTATVPEWLDINHNKVFVEFHSKDITVPNGGKKQIRLYLGSQLVTTKASNAFTLNLDTTCFVYHWDLYQGFTGNNNVLVTLWITFKVVKER